jgi:hypothetical protein
MTDESNIYRSAGQYVDYELPAVHNNTVEGYFSIYQHCGEQHLHRYLAEYEFRYNNREALGCNDTDRTVTSLQGIVGKRLTYRRIDA